MILRIVFNLSILATLALSALPSHAAELSAQACEKKIVAFQKKEFAKTISEIDGEEFDLARVKAEVLESETNAQLKTLEVTTQVSAARMQVCYFTSASMSDGKCRINKQSLIEFECENDDFLY